MCILCKSWAMIFIKQKKKIRSRQNDLKYYDDMT